MCPLDQATFAKPQPIVFLVNKTSIKPCQGSRPDDCVMQRQVALMPLTRLLAHDNDISAVEIANIHAEGLFAVLDRR